MCGINGVFAYNTAASAPREADLLLTRDYMSARGPDGVGAWWSSNRRLGFGHRRLAIIDVSDRASQPMTSADEQFTIVFNGEIYNHEELRGELIARGCRFRTTSDTEVLLQLYAIEGEQMLHRLRGMFAFAIWDQKREGVFLARDPYGIKPLFYANDGWIFRFASQVKALLASGEVSREIEPAGLVGFHLFGSVPQPFTLYRDIRALPAGHSLWVDAAGPREPRCYANIAGILAEGAKADISAQSSLEEAVRDAALESVRYHLVADVEVGVFLSAGIDSGAVLGLMRDAGQARIRAVTLRFEEFSGEQHDEAPLATKIAQAYEATHIVRTVTRAEFRADLPHILHAMDQPSIDGVNTWFVSKAAKEAGLKVALSGVGGDELLAGYPSFIDIPKWRRQFGALASIPGVGRVSRTLIRRLAPGLAASQPKAAGMLEYANSDAGAYLLRRGVLLPFDLKTQMDPELVDEGLRRLAPLDYVERAIQPDPGSRIGRVAAMESALYMRNQLLNDADWAGMAQSIEIRTPLVDAHLLRKLSPHIARMRAGEGKHALAAAPLRTLEVPKERSKTGFNVPMGAWLSGDDLSERSSTTDLGSASRKWAKRVLASQVRATLPIEPLNPALPVNTLNSKRAIAEAQA